MHGSPKSVSFFARGLLSLPTFVLVLSLVGQGNLFGQSVGLEFFEARIRPVLVEHCYECHNHEEDQGGLAVDHRAGLRSGGEGGKLITPGDPANSRLLAILRHEIDGLEMPQDGPKLAPSVIEDFKTWIAAGAKDPRDQPPSAEQLSSSLSWEKTLQRRKQWWCFQPIQASELPLDSNAIDQLIRERLTERDLSPADPAEPQVLLRRLFLALVGVPPTPAQFQTWIDRFEVGPRQQVVQELIDELLASDHFGERWARHWMDWIRYAESHGSEGDPRIENAWIYRDYLIRALNEDVPYDQLVREHIAGDLLEKPRRNPKLGINESMIGPAHWRMVFHGFAPTDALDEKVRFVDDQVNAFSKAFLGLTVSCARCHDHKFDAISQADYYALFGILSSCRPGRAVIDLPEKARDERNELQALKHQLRPVLAKHWRDSLTHLPTALAGLLDDEKKTRQADSLVFPLQQFATQSDSQSAWTSCFGAADVPNKESCWSLSDPAVVDDWYRFGIGLVDSPSKAGEFVIESTGTKAVAGIFPGGVYSHAISTKHPARLTSPDFPIDQQSDIWVLAMGEGATLRPVIQDYPRRGTVYPVVGLKPTWNWQKLDLSYWAGDSIHLEFVTAKDAPLLVDNRDRGWFGASEIRLRQPNSKPPQQPRNFQAIGDVSPDPPSSLDQAIQRYVQAIGEAIDDWQRNSIRDSQAHLLNACLDLNLLPNGLESLSEAKPIVEQYRAIEADIVVPTRVPGLDETRGRQQPLYVRGDHKQPADLIPKRFLEAIDPTPYQGNGSGRLELAEDVLRPDNPLTKRVIVNRVWHHLFGRGIVSTPDNFGRLGSRPTHPELLDHLADAFAVEGWSLKTLIRKIVSTETWQQDSLPSAHARQIDPDNLYLSHANVRRLEAESIRDSLLAASQQLNPQLHGPPTGRQSTRRSIYLPVIRNSLDPFLRTFDFPEPFSTTGRRDATNVPAQSLAMMNSKQVSGAAANLARVLAGESDEARIQDAFVRLFCREPSQKDRKAAADFLNETRGRFQRLLRQRAELQEQLKQEQSFVNETLNPIRKRLTQSPTVKHPLPKPVSRWEFEADLKDSVGQAHGTSHQGAKIEAGALVVGAGGYVTAPVRQELTAKTLEAWVQLKGLDQRAGGVMTVQTTNGTVFDSIVYAEKSPHRWLAGSNNFRRTESFEGPAERQAGQQMVHLAIVYQADGQIIGYRNGEPYGHGYQSKGPQTFRPGQTVISFGVRHLPAVGNRLLQGRIDKAQLYDRALSAAEVEASFNGGANFVSHEQVLAELEPKQREQISAAEAKIKNLGTQIKSLGSVSQSSLDHRAWTDLVHSLLALKEFLYVR